MSHPEKEYLREQVYIQAEKEVYEREQWLEWQDYLKQQKPAKIEVKEIKTSFELLEDE